MADVKPLKLDSGTIKQMGSGDTLPVANGGTGATTLTDNGVLIGNGTGAVDVTAAGATGEVLVGVTGGNPVFSSSYIGKSIAIYKSSDESVTSSTTLQNDDHLSFSIASNEVWKGFMILQGSANASGGFKCDITAPSGASGSMNLQGASSSFSSGNVAIGTGFGATSVIALGNKQYITFTITNSSTAGTVNFRFAQNASFGTATIVSAGSFLLATRTA